MQHIILQNQVQVILVRVGDNCYNNSIGYVTPSNSGFTGYTAISTRQYCEEYCRYSPVLRVREGWILPVLASIASTGSFVTHQRMSWETHNNEPASSLQLVYQQWWRYLPAGIGVFPFSLSSDFKRPITDIPHYYSMAHTEEPLLPLCEQLHMYTCAGIHSITVPILDVLLCCAFLQLMQLCRISVDR